MLIELKDFPQISSARNEKINGVTIESNDDVGVLYLNKKKRSNVCVYLDS